METGLILSDRTIKAFWYHVNIGAEDECWEWKQKPYSSHGYPVFYIRTYEPWDGYRQVLTHRLSLMLKLGRHLQLGHHALHTCDNKICCNPKHLYEGTEWNNGLDRTRRNRVSFGEKNPSHILIEAQVIEILESQESQYKLARMYGVSRGTIQKIIDGNMWSRVRKEVESSRLNLS